MSFRTALLTSAAAVAYWALSSTLLSALPSELAVAVEHWFAPNISNVWDSLMAACFSGGENASTVVNECFCAYFGYGGYYYTELYTAESSLSSGNEVYPQSWWNWRQPEVDSRQMQDKTVNVTILQPDYNSEYYYYGGFYGWRWYCSASHAGYTDVYSYEGYYSDSHQESGTEAGSSALTQKHFAYGIVGTISLLSSLRIAGRVGMWCAARLRAWVLHLLPGTVWLRNDLLDILKIFFIAVIDVGLVLAKRAGPLKRPLRSADDLEGDILVGDNDAQGEAIVYRPLHLMQARFGGGRRWKQVAPKRYRACYNPRGQGHCLFKASGFVAAKHGCGVWSVARLRAIAQQELGKAHAAGQKIEGHTVAEWAQRLGKTVQELIN
eukprot:4113776-Amphidinium_carterae.2